MNPLTLIPARARLYAYVLYGLAGLVVSSVAVYFTAVHQAVPVWVGGAAAVLGALTAPFGALAGSNVTHAAPAPLPAPVTLSTHPVALSVPAVPPGAAPGAGDVPA